MGGAINQLVSGNPGSGGSQQVVESAAGKMQTMGYSADGTREILAGGQPQNASDELRLRIETERQKQELERLKTARGTQDRIEELQAQVTQNRAKTNQSIFRTLVDTIFGK